MFDLGMQELIVIFVVALLVFGPKKLPELGRTLSKWVIEIRRGINHARAQMEAEVGEDSLSLPDDVVKNLPKGLRDEIRSAGSEPGASRPHPPDKRSEEQAESGDRTERTG